MDDLAPIEAALAGVAAPERVVLAGPVLVERVFGALGIDDDEVHAAARRGLFLAAAEGDPASACGPGSRAARETAEALVADGAGSALAAALGELHRAVPADCPLVAAAVAELAADPALAADALAQVVLHRALEG